MLFHVVTIVWGAHHTDLFLDLTLPNVLSPGNLPAMAAGHAVRYRIFTTPADRDRVLAHPNGRRLHQIVPVDFVLPLGERAPDVQYHVHWFHRSATEAKRDGAVAMFVPPDTLWSDGTFRHGAAIMASGKKAVAVPFLQVVAETCVPEAKARFGGPVEQGLTIPPAELVALARRHLHPLTGAATPGSPHARPALEMHWPVPGDGFLSRFAVREAFAIDPRRCPMTFLWYAGGAEDLDGIHFSADSDDMVMLSVDPLAKYIPIYIPDHTVAPADVARSTLHPLNDTEQTRAFARRRVQWHEGPMDTGPWQRRHRRSDAAFGAMVANRVAMRLWAMLKRIGCQRAAALLAVGLHATPLARRWRHSGSLRVYAPTDRALAALGDAALERLMRPGGEAALRRFLLAHAMPAEAAPPPDVVPAGAPHRLDWLEVQAVDRVLERAEA